MFGFVNVVEATLRETTRSADGRSTTVGNTGSAVQPQKKQ